MKRLAILLMIVLCSTTLFAQKTRYSQEPPKPKSQANAIPAIDYPLKVHVSASRILNYCDNFGLDSPTCTNGLSADVLADGKKLIFWGASTIDKYDFVVLAPGDYRARLTNDIHNPNNSVIHQEYDVVLSDATIWHCRIVGISE